ncbi:MAG: DUF3793 family protein [Eubacterium sp.]|nr:DUF3793 family protein [Eubacterium sp.]
MSERVIVEFCAPTLAGIKAANLFSCKYSDRTKLEEEIRTINRLLVKKGIRVIPVKYSEERVLIYVYRQVLLEKALCDKTASEILTNMGYEAENVYSCICLLRHKLNSFSDASAFPHEIGLFLGYPPEDVKGFIDHKGECSKCNGCWKVYGDKDKAVAVFERYKKCTEDYIRRYAGGAKLDKLAVAI